MHIIYHVEQWYSRFVFPQSDVYFKIVLFRFKCRPFIYCFLCNYVSFFPLCCPFRFRNKMTQAGFTIAGTAHPICPVMLGDARLASVMADDMLKLGEAGIKVHKNVVSESFSNFCPIYTRVRKRINHQLKDIKYRYFIKWILKCCKYKLNFFLNLIRSGEFLVLFRWYLFTGQA